jgi:hypothetical protein
MNLSECSEDKELLSVANAKDNISSPLFEFNLITILTLFFEKLFDAHL